jgi:hypothetical protein
MLRALILTTAVACAAMTACATDQGPAVDDTASIRSASALDAHLRETPSSPLNRMSAEGKQRFLDSLVFSEKGLASYRYAELRAELTPVEIEQVLGLFGVDRNASLLTRTPSSASSLDDVDIGPDPDTGGEGDREGYKCESPGSCVKATNYICTDKC